MSLSRANSRRFSTAESFRLFMEGIRGLQLNEDESAKGGDGSGPTNDFPSAADLAGTLLLAYQNLNECVVQYPTDVLPRYYRGIVFSLKAQDLQARQLLEFLDHLERLPSACPEAEALLQRAAEDFQFVISETKGQMRLYAQYNRAQAMARLAKPEDWVAALQTLSDMDLDSPDLDSFPRWKRVVCRIILYLNENERSLSAFFGQLFRQAGGETGVAASAAKAKLEQTAFALQVDLLSSFVLSRLNPALAAQKKDRLKSSSAKQSGKESQATGFARLNSFLPRIRAAAIPNEARDSMEADYWNKSSYLLWEQAREERNTELRGQILQQAQTCAEQALALNGRKNWAPAQLNLARILVAEARVDEARLSLQKILGVVKDGTSVVPQSVPDVESITKVILQMALTNDPTTIADSIHAAWGPLDRVTLQALIQAIAGRVPSGVVTAVLARLSQTPVTATEA
jgi:hypothetical protein